MTAIFMKIFDHNASSNLAEIIDRHYRYINNPACVKLYCLKVSQNNIKKFPKKNRKTRFCNRLWQLFGKFNFFKSFQVVLNILPNFFSSTIFRL